MLADLPMIGLMRATMKKGSKQTVNAPMITPRVFVALRSDFEDEGVLRPTLNPRGRILFLAVRGAVE